MKHMIQPFGIDMHKNVLTDTKAVKHMHFYEADKTNTILNISFIPSSTTEWIICYNDNNDISEFICIGCQNIFTTLSLKEFDHYLIKTREDGFISSGFNHSKSHKGQFPDWNDCFEFTQSEIDSMQTGSYEQIEVEK